mmetsp:Transcript_42981/g.100960  ORF Transcript_42981/g.100960 Transcript_42981/m.100960 type:complete len:237 (-) Transcript_42981:1240-1950(-)
MVVDILHLNLQAHDVDSLCSALHLQAPCDELFNVNEPRFVGVQKVKQESCIMHLQLVATQQCIHLGILQRHCEFFFRELARLVCIHLSEDLLHRLDEEGCFFLLLCDHALDVVPFAIRVDLDQHTCRQVGNNDDSEGDKHNKEDLVSQRRWLHRFNKVTPQESAKSGLVTCEESLLHCGKVFAELRVLLQNIAATSRIAKRISPMSQEDAEDVGYQCCEDQDPRPRPQGNASALEE